MSEYVPGHMTDEQALETLKSMKLTIGRGSAKTMFQQGLLEAICHAVVALEDKVENKDEWIPVSERLPEINVDVIVTDIETTGTYAAYYLGDGFWECDNGTHKNRIIAWMPFPEPYKKGGEE